MASRRRSRQYALQALYQSDLAEEPLGGSINALWSGMLDGEGMAEDSRVPDSEEVEFAQRIAFGVEQNRTRIDDLIESCSTNWRLPRMPVVDRNILRMAAYELLECQDIPATVSINEAVELAKRFGTADSRAFVNGIVDRMARMLNRLPGGDNAARRRTTQPGS
jgi:transcription antitermination protein NusB